MPTTSDDLQDAAKEAVDAYFDRFTTATGQLFGPIDAEMRALRFVMSEYEQARASLAPSPAAGEAIRVYLVATGHAPDGRELYERHDAPVPMCDYEVLYSAPPAPSQPAPAQAVPLTPERIAQAWREANNESLSTGVAPHFALLHKLGITGEPKHG